MKGAILTLALASTLTASAAIPQTNLYPIAPAPQSEQVERTQAFISGVKESVAYAQLPPVLVELSNLPSKAAVWVEVKRGNADSARPGVTVESKFFLVENGSGILAVPGMNKACKQEGIWTVSVKMSGAKGTTTLSSTTFFIQSERVVSARTAVPARS